MYNIVIVGRRARKKKRGAREKKWECAKLGRGDRERKGRRDKKKRKAGEEDLDDK